MHCCSTVKKEHTVIPLLQLESLYMLLYYVKLLYVKTLTLNICIKRWGLTLK